MTLRAAPLWSGALHRRDDEKRRNKAVRCGPAELEPSSVVLWGPGALVGGSHVVQVAAVFMPTVV